MIFALRPPRTPLSPHSLRPALFLVASGLLPVVVSLTMALNNSYEWRPLAARRIDSDLRSFFIVFGVALAFEALLTFLVFLPHRLGRVALRTISVILFLLLATIQLLETLGVSDFFLEGSLPLAVWTAVFATLTIVISARLDGVAFHGSR